MLNAMREGLRLDYEGKGLLSFVSNEHSGSHGGDKNSSGRCLLTSVKPTRANPLRKQCSFIPPAAANRIGGLEPNGEGKKEHCSQNRSRHSSLLRNIFNVIPYGFPSRDSVHSS